MKSMPDVLIILSALAILFSIIGAFGAEVWLASTQWVIVAAALATYAIYFKIRR